MNECEQICYQQWVDMYNKKDKECFDLQLKLSRVEEICKKWLNSSWSCLIVEIIWMKN